MAVMIPGAQAAPTNPPATETALKNLLYSAIGYAAEIEAVATAAQALIDREWTPPDPLPLHLRAILETIRSQAQFLMADAGSADDLAGLAIEQEGGAL